MNRSPSVYCVFSLSFRQLSFHFLSCLFPISLSPHLVLAVMLHAISPESLCFVSHLQAERFITAICSFYHSPSLSLSLRPSPRLTRALCNCEFRFSCLALYLLSSALYVFHPCSIISVLVMLDSPVIPSVSSLFISVLPSALA